jgi:hypothetical protein
VAIREEMEQVAAAFGKNYLRDVEEAEFYEKLPEIRNACSDRALVRAAHFFEENEYIYIYTPGHILTYRIIAAYKYDSRHLLNTIDYSDNTVFEDYLNYIKNPTSMMVNKREVELDLDSKILTLSTCIGDEKDYRYLVQGVLIKDERTK